MPQVADLLRTLETLAPPAFAYEGDRIGLQIGDPEQAVSRALVTLDASRGAITDAVAQGCQMVIAHHPVIWNPVRHVVRGDPDGDRAWALARAGLSLAVAHTNWDAAAGGVNDELARRLGLFDVEPFGGGTPRPRWKLTIFVPRSHGPVVLDAVAQAGAGEIGRYDRCAFLSEGMGTFRPLPGSNPTVGEVGVPQRVAEDRLEVFVPEDRRTTVERALRATHPYETPAFDWVRLDDAVPMPIGRVGQLPQPVALRNLATTLGTGLETKCWTWGNPGHLVERVAVVGGAGGDLWPQAWQAGAQVLVTGEAKHSDALAASEAGLAVIAAGHYATEHPGVEALATRLREAVTDVSWHVWVPSPGEGGRNW